MEETPPVQFEDELMRDIEELLASCLHLREVDLNLAKEMQDLESRLKQMRRDTEANFRAIAQLIVGKEMDGHLVLAKCGEKTVSVRVRACSPQDDVNVVAIDFGEGKRLFRVMVEDDVIVLDSAPE